MSYVRFLTEKELTLAKRLKDLQVAPQTNYYFWYLLSLYENKRPPDSCIRYFSVDLVRQEFTVDFFLNKDRCVEELPEEFLDSLDRETIVAHLDKLSQYPCLYDKLVQICRPLKYAEVAKVVDSWSDKAVLTTIDRLMDFGSLRDDHYIEPAIFNPLYQRLVYLLEDEYLFNDERLYKHELQILVQKILSRCDEETEDTVYDIMQHTRPLLHEKPFNATKCSPKFLFNYCQDMFAAWSPRQWYKFLGRNHFSLECFLNMWSLPFFPRDARLLCCFDQDQIRDCLEELPDDLTIDGQKIPKENYHLLGSLYPCFEYYGRYDINKLTKEQAYLLTQGFLVRWDYRYQTYFADMYERDLVDSRLLKIEILERFAANHKKLKTADLIRLDIQRPYGYQKVQVSDPENLVLMPLSVRLHGKYTDIYLSMSDEILKLI